MASLRFPPEWLGDEKGLHHCWRKPFMLMQYGLVAVESTTEVIPYCL
jgi:hypothetical protein